MSTDRPTTANFRMGLIWMTCLVAAMGGLLFGYDWVVIGGAKPFYEQHFAIADNPRLQGFAQSSALVGCIFGALVSGSLTDRFGRKRLLIVAAALFTVSAIMTALAPSFSLFNTARWIGGVGIGLASSLSPLYIAELSPAFLRGRLVSVNQLTIVIGIVAAQLVNWLIAVDVPAGVSGTALLDTWCGQVGWRWMFAAETVPAALFFMLMFAVPESARWLAKAGRFAEAHATLERFGGPAYATEQLAAIRQTLGADEIGRVRFRDLLQPGVSWVLFVGVALAVLQQWCGINVIFNYAEEVFASAGYDVRSIMVAIFATGVVNLVFTLVAMGTVDWLGRRVLMLLGSASLAVLFAVLGWLYHRGSTGWHMVVLVLTAIACYAMSLAPVTWVVISEIFPNRIRGAAMSVAVLALWIACTALTYTFPSLHDTLGAGPTFWLYAGICAAGFLFILRYLPETKDKSLEQIEAELIGIANVDTKHPLPAADSVAE
jgi:SP family sugar porter-like MFS transporter